MAISFSCDCGQEFKVNDSHAGKRIKCQGCGSTVKIPSLPSKSTSDSGGVAVGKATKKKKRVDDDDDDPLVHSTSDYDSAYDFDIGKVPLGKLIEEGDPDSPSAKKKAKKSDGASGDKPKKKKKKDDEEAGNPLLIGLFVVLGLCSLSVVGYFGYQQFSSGGGDSRPLEKTFVVHSGPEKIFSFEYPSDWTIEQSSGGTGGKPPIVLMNGDGAIFRIKGSVGGSMVGTIAQQGGAAGIAIPGQDAPVGGGDDQSPETTVHQFQQEFFKADYKTFDEEDMKKIETPFGEGRISIFTAQESFLSPKIKGYRATFMDNNYQYNIRAYVKEGQWEKFQPTFRRMIDSLKRGG
ncbi:MAG TPA: hypothetical protein VM452_12205 [Caulifigura sp.]|nr:hypothetical protein [Caulifigura sp.]